MVTRLSEVLSIEILSNWKNLRAVANVDSAFCNKSYRWDFQCLLSDPTFASSDSTYRNSKSFWTWCERNGIKVQLMKALKCDNKSDSLVAKIDCSKVIEFHVDQLGKVCDVAKLVNKSIQLKIFKVSDGHMSSTKVFNQFFFTDFRSHLVWFD